MKLHQVWMVAVLTVTVLCGNAAAEYQVFGNGRFLRKLRDDITGKSSDKPEPKPGASEKNSKDPRAKSPTPASRSNAKAPTPALRPGSAPAPAAKPRSAINFRDQQQTTPRATQQPSANSTVGAKHSAKKPTMGFGMYLEAKGENFVVSKIDPKGNAHEAGIKEGDLITEAGGVELGSMEEFNEITEILGQGDQLEFEIARRGKKKKILIQFGDVPEESELAETTAPKKENDYSFVPGDDDKPQTGMRSVMSQNGSGSNSMNLAAPQNRLSADRQRMIEQQQLQIQKMQREIERLRQQNGNSSIAPAESSAGGTILEGPSLLGPRN